MDSIRDIWNAVLEKISLSGEISSTAMSAWFSDSIPVALDGTRFVLQTTSDFKRNIILQRFGDTIRSVLGDILSGEIDLLVVLEDELAEYLPARSAGADNGDVPEASAYTFDRFIVGQSNKFAHAAAEAVATNPGGAYNPLFLYGNSGLGKTHLLYAISHVVRERFPDYKIAFVKGEDFTNQMIMAIRNNTTDAFRQKYRNVDLLLVDDIQFIAGKIAVQEEFFNTFNNVYEAGHQIVLASDRPPLEIKRLEDRLRSRFEGGLMADIQPPDFETRMAIIRNKAQGFGLSLSEEIVEYIAQSVTDNIRQIEGVVHRLTAFRDIMNNSIDLEGVKNAIKDVIRTGVFIPTPDIIILETGRFMSVDPEDIRSQKRSKQTALARQISMYLIRNLTNLPLVEIGHEFNNRDHSTVLQSIRRIEDLIRTDPTVADSVRDITANINSRGG